METVVKQSGQYALVQDEEGFVWMMTCKAGGHWYWHPHELVWTGYPQPSPTVEEAMAGFDPEASLKDVEFHHHETPPHCSA
jgi:hypothetical protein